MTPGVSRGTSTMDCCRCRGASGSVLPMTTSSPQSGFMAPVANHLRPVTTYSSPSRTMRVAMFVASDDATAGSVMQNADRRAASSSGSSQRSRCSGVAKCASSSMLPVSGAAQFRATGASLGLYPVSSATGAYCRLVRPPPRSAAAPPEPAPPGGRNRFHSPRSFAVACRCRTTGRNDQSSGVAATCAASTGSAGSTSPTRKSRTRAVMSRVVASGAKSIRLLLSRRRCRRARRRAGPAPRGPAAPRGRRSCRTRHRRSGRRCTGSGCPRG